VTMNAIVTFPGPAKGTVGHESAHHITPVNTAVWKSFHMAKVDIED
jgi:hypothetical protein